MRYLNHTEIDKGRWDQCVKSSINAKPYGLSGWLDAVTTNWYGYILGDYDAVFPVPVRKKYFRNSVYQPVFTQQLGLFFTHADQMNRLPEILADLKLKFSHGYLQLNDQNFLPDLDLAVRKNYQLNLRDLEKSQLSKSHLRSLKKAKKAELSIQPIDDDDFWLGLRGYNPAYSSDIKRQEAILSKLIDFLNSSQLGLGIGSFADGDVQAGIWMAKLGKVGFYLMPFTTYEGKSVGAMHHLIFHLRDHIGELEVFDFEGSELPGVERFILGFDAQLRPYPTIKW